MSILGPTGQPIQKKWEDMSTSEQLLNIRNAIGWMLKIQEEIVKRQDETMKAVLVIQSDVDDITDAINEYGEASDGETGRGRESAEGEVRAGAESGSPDESGSGPDQAGSGD